MQCIEIPFKECVADESLVRPQRINKKEKSERGFGTKYFGQFMIFTTFI